MRHPTKGQSEDDLSRLTGTSSTSSSNSSHSDNNDNGRCNETCAIISSQGLILRVNNNNNNNDTENVNNLKNSTHHHHHANLPSYLPEYIDPLEWQKSRKRKERLDSTSSITNDRKLVRSNSEELISNSDYEVIRRVSSHEDFKKQPQPTLQEKNINNVGVGIDENILKPIQENDIQQKTEHNNNDNNNIINKDPSSNILIRHRLDTSPARSHNYHRWSPPNRSDDSDCEHERRRSSERFSKARAPPGRKAGVIKKAGGGSRRNGNNGGYNENTYKYDISALKYERRGFVSKFQLEDRSRKEEAADGEKIINNDIYDNNLIDLNQTKNHCQQQNASPPLTPKKQQQQNIQQAKQQQNDIENSAETLPWDRSVQDYQTPVLCRRFSPFQYTSVKEDEAKSKVINNNNTNNSNNNNNNNQTQPSSKNQFHLNICSGDVGLPAGPVVNVDNEPVRSFRTFTKMENLKTREVMQSLPPLCLTQTPEERLKYVNKKLTALKKRIQQLEENFERINGYRPSQVDRFNDKQIKNVLTEINKLRKEKHELKADPMAALGLKVSGDMDSEKKLIKMKETLAEIEKKLKEKRNEFKRSEILENLTAEQLVQEKTAVQHSLLYFESLYGRPSNRLERDVARSLYDRYRIIKRMVNRSITNISSSGIGIPELPTIMEHEALSYEMIQSQDISNSSPSETIGSNIIPLSTAVDTSNDDSDLQQQYSNSTTTDSTDSTNETTTTESNLLKQQNQQQQSNIFEENLHQLSLSDLWEHLDKVRDEKKDLKKIIRDFETLFEQQNGRKMLKNDRKTIDETYGQYKEKKAKARLLQALIKKQIAK